MLVSRQQCQQRVHPTRPCHAAALGKAATASLCGHTAGAGDYTVLGGYGQAGHSHLTGEILVLSHRFLQTNWWD